MRVVGIVGATWAVLGASLSLAAAAGGEQPPPGYYGLAPGHDYPASAARLERYRSRGDLTAQRRHAWALFAGLTAATPDRKAARWETWYSLEETFQAEALGAGPRPIQRHFRVPQQFLPGGVTASHGPAILAYVLFNNAAYRHIRGERLYQRSGLQALADGGAADRLFPDNRTIPEFPRRAIALKAAWWPVAADKPTAMPVWDGDFDPANVEGQNWSTWKRVVAVTAALRPQRGASADVALSGKVWPASHLVSLRAFHVVPVDTALADQLNGEPKLEQVAEAALGRPYRAGDWLALVGLHVTTKEIKDWVWATYWWHDRPNAGPFAKDRPAALTRPWRNYLMDVSYDVASPAAPDGGPRIAYNPWLEGRFPNGARSNCMTCHQRANAFGVDFLPVTRGAPSPSDAAFARGTLRTDFMWSIPTHAN